MVLLWSFSISHYLKLFGSTPVLKMCDINKQTGLDWNTVKSKAMW